MQVLKVENCFFMSCRLCDKWKEKKFELKFTYPEFKLDKIECDSD